MKEVYEDWDYPLWVWQHVAPSGAVLASGVSWNKVEPSNHTFPLDDKATVYARTIVWKITRENECKPNLNL